MSEAYALNEDRKFSYADYKAWELKPGERFELIYGVAYAMSAPNTLHQQILINLGSEIHTFLKGKPCRVFPAPFDVRLFYQEDESDDTVVQPDLSVICDPGKLGEEGCHGAPDMVVEILSPSNTAMEMERKRLLYKDAGVREYWIVDPKNKLIIINLFKTDSAENGDYFIRFCKIQDTAKPVVLPGLEIPLSTIFAE